MDSASYDFWLGNWNGTFDENGKTCHATNHITRIMNNKYIHEDFTIIDGENKGYKGESFSVLDQSDKKWKQTWIDSQGGYLDFVGDKDGDTKIFKRNFTNPNGKIIYQRMRFYNIQKDSFTWDWESSKDGSTWQLDWRINYTRVK